MLFWRMGKRHTHLGNIIGMYPVTSVRANTCKCPTGTMISAVCNASKTTSRHLQPASNAADPLKLLHSLACQNYMQPYSVQALAQHCKLTVLITDGLYLA